MYLHTSHYYFIIFELYDLYSSLAVVRMITSRRMRWAGQVVRRGNGKAYTGFWWGTMRVKDHWGDPGVDGRIILSWFFKK
jgi:hypothetical protein